MTLVSTHTPRNFLCHGSSHFQRNCDLTDCHPFLSVYPFDHDSSAALTIIFQASQKPRIAFHACCRSVFPLDIDFLRPGRQCQPSLLPDYVPCRRVSRRSVWQLLSSTTSAGFFEFPNSLFALCSLGNFSIDPFACHITVSTHLHCGSSFARVHSGAFKTQISGCFFLEPPFFISIFSFSVFSGEHHLVQDVGDELVLVFWRGLLFSHDHPFFLTRLTCSHHVPHIIPIVPTPLMLPSCAVFRDLLSSFLCCRDCHHAVLLTYTLSSGNQSPHSLFH